VRDTLRAYGLLVRASGRADAVGRDGS
jgi:hypothetical protein